MQEKAKAEQAQIMMNNSSDSCSRQVSQLHKELRVSRQEGLSLQGQLDTSLAQEGEEEALQGGPAAGDRAAAGCPAAQGCAHC